VEFASEVNHLATHEYRGSEREAVVHDKRGCGCEAIVGREAGGRTIYTFNQSAKSGALFIEFHVNGDPNRARGYFKNIDGAIVDQFTITAQPPGPR
jgi:hypothetical protein